MQAEHEDEELSLATHIRMHHPKLARRSKRRPEMPLLIAYAAATLVAHLLGAGGAFILGSLAALAVHASLQIAYERRDEAERLTYQLSNISSIRASTIMRETAGDIGALQARIDARQAGERARTSS